MLHNSARNTKLGQDNNAKFACETESNSQVLLYVARYLLHQFFSKIDIYHQCNEAYWAKEL